jgi:AcrR family transcriptional regulator
MRQFAEKGYHGARLSDLADSLGISKASVLQHFGSKDALFLAAYRKAVTSFSAYLDAPIEILEKGFFETLHYWLGRTELWVREDWVPYRVALVGNYEADLRLKREINRYLTEEDPYGTRAFVRRGIEQGEVRSDIPMDLIVSVLDWTMERFQDALVTEELDPGLFRQIGDSPEKRQARIQQFLEILRGAIGAR